MDAKGTGPVFIPLPDLAAAAPPGFALPRRPRIEGAPEHFDRGVDQFGGTSGGGAKETFPFAVSNASSGGVAKVSVQFGTVNSIVPTMGGTSGDPLDANPAPTLNVITGVVYLEVNLYASDGATWSKGDVETVVVKNAASLPTPTVTKARVLLATIVVTAGNVTDVNQAVTSSLGFLVCSGQQNFWQQ